MTLRVGGPNLCLRRTIIDTSACKNGFDTGDGIRVVSRRLAEGQI